MCPRTSESALPPPGRWATDCRRSRQHPARCRQRGAYAVAPHLHVQVMWPQCWPAATPLTADERAAQFESVTARATMRWSDQPGYADRAGVLQIPRRATGSTCALPTPSNQHLPPCGYVNASPGPRITRSRNCHGLQAHRICASPQAQSQHGMCSNNSRFHQQLPPLLSRR